MYSCMVAFCQLCIIKEIDDDEERKVKERQGGRVVEKELVPPTSKSWLRHCLQGLIIYSVLITKLH